MSSFSRWQSGSAALLALGTLAGAVAPLVISASASAQTSFSDVPSSYWARPFIQTLADEGVISGFPDGTYRPDAPITRAQFAAIVRQAFNEDDARTARMFGDVSSAYWAAPAIREAYVTGFMSGYPDGTFKPDQQIPKVQALVSLASGLRLSPSGSTALRVYSDAGDIPSYATNGVTAATQKGIVVNYPNVSFLNPGETTTRADVAAYIYQALVSKGRLKPLPTNSEARRYIVAGNTSGTTTDDTDSTSTTQDPNLRVAEGTNIAVKYPDSGTIAVTRDETRPLTLRVAQDIKNSKGRVLIPRDSQVVGQLFPRYDSSRKFLGVQFVAQRLRIGNQTYPITNVASEIVTSSRPVNAETVKDTSASQAAQAILGTIFGGQGTTSQNQRDEVLVIDPETQLQLRVGSDFYVRSVS